MRLDIHLDKSRKTITIHYSNKKLLFSLLHVFRMSFFFFDFPEGTTVYRSGFSPDR